MTMGDLKLFSPAVGSVVCSDRIEMSGVGVGFCPTHSAPSSILYSVFRFFIACYSLSWNTYIPYFAS